jgi:Ca2+-binding RTX toxin-like protein
VLSVFLSAAMGAGALSGFPGCSPGKISKSEQALAPVGQGFNLNASDLRFILTQIKIAQNHAAGGALIGTAPNQIPAGPQAELLPYGLRTVDGSWNNLLPNQERFGAADRAFPRATTPSFRPAEGGTSFAQTSGTVTDSRPRTISNLIVDQSPANPSAVFAAGPGAVPDASDTLFIPNAAPDVGLSAPYNSMFTLFGQFFDHGLDLVTKGGNGTVFMPLQPDDPLFVAGSPTNFMVLSRATNQPGPDGVLGTGDDIQDGTNTTTPFVDQNQTYTSHPSHQVFLREYAVVAGRPVPTGRLLDGAIPKNIANWAEVKAQARNVLGIALTDADIFNGPLLATDPYGHFLPGPVRGCPQVVVPTAPGGLVEGDPAAPVSVATATKSGHAFLDDIAHSAVPTPGLTPDADAVVNFPAPQPAGTYDDEHLAIHFITGDGRGNENIGLTSIHTVFHSEHNRLAADITNLINTALTAGEITDWNAVDAASGWGFGERLFQASRFVTEMEYQHLVFEEFARKVQPMINAFAEYHADIDPAIMAEFAHAVYRFGHSLLTETVARTNADGTTNDIPLLDAFLNPRAFNDGGPDPVTGAPRTITADQAVGATFRGMSRQIGNELDEFVTNALRNRLLGLPLDLASINLARGRSEGIPTLNSARRQFFAATSNAALMPYTSWVDFGLGIRHPESLINYVAAYGTHPSVTGATTMAAKRAAATLLVANDPTVPDAFDFMNSLGAFASVGGVTVTGVDDIDMWVGGIGEKQAPFGGLLGSTFNFIFETQLEHLQDGDRFYYLSRTAGMNLLVQLEGNSFAELVKRNSDVEVLPADAFSWPEFLFNLSALGTTGPILDDPSTPAIESTMPDLLRMPDGTIRYSGPAHIVMTGTNDPAVIDRMFASEGDDTLQGNGGRDIMEGGAGNDVLIGGEGDDIMTDTFGDDVLKGGDGNDALSSGAGLGADLNQGGRGNDFVVGGSDLTETFGGPGNDFIFAGDSTDTVFGDDGDDWEEGGGQSDLLQGDNGAPFANDVNQAGNDVIIGGGGNDDYDMEGGDDIGVADAGIEKIVGNLGFDWATYKNNPQPAIADLNIGIFAPVDINVLRDKFKTVEGLSGWNLNDQLKGSDSTSLTLVGHELTPEGMNRITGLTALVAGSSGLDPVLGVFNNGDIILGGAGSDVIEGRSGNDLIDGDAWLNVQLQAPNPATGGTQLVDSMLTLRADVFAGLINPGDITIVRSIEPGTPAGDIDVAMYSGLRAEYTVTQNADGTVTVAHTVPVGGGGGGVGANNGIDTLRNIERLAFADVITDGNGLNPVPNTPNSPASSTLAIAATNPGEDQPLNLIGNVADADGVNGATLTYSWQAESSPTVWTEVGTGLSFAPGDIAVGRRLRVVATFQDLHAIPAVESATTAATSPVTAINDAPVGVPTLSDTTPQVGAALTANDSGIFDADGKGPPFFQWMSSGAPIAGETSSSFTPTAAQLGQQLSIVVSYTDRQGFSESVTSASSAAVVEAAAAAGAPGTGDPGATPGTGGTPGTAGAASGGSGGGCQSLGGGGLISLASLAAAALALRRRRAR